MTLSFLTLWSLSVRVIPLLCWQCHHCSMYVNILMLATTFYIQTWGFFQTLTEYSMQGKQCFPLIYRCVTLTVAVTFLKVRSWAKTGEYWHLFAELLLFYHALLQQCDFFFRILVWRSWHHCRSERRKVVNGLLRSIMTI